MMRLGRNVWQIYRTIEALLVVHNFLERRRDNPGGIWGYDGQEDDDVPEVLGEVFGGAERVDLGNDELRRAGLLRRKALLNFMD